MIHRPPLSLISRGRKGLEGRRMGLEIGDWEEGVGGWGERADSARECNTLDPDGGKV